MNVKKLAVTCFLVLILALSGCYSRQTEFFGSFTAEKTYSYDYKYYAIQTNESQMINVTIYDAESNEIIDKFSPARSIDFWGICWEKDTYNIWIQSADIGILCYEYQDGKWVYNGDAQKPAYIISRYDEEYRNNTDMQSNIYKNKVLPE